MKKYIIGLIFMIAVVSVKSQTNQYRIDTLPCYKDYNGEWLYANGLDTIKMFIWTQRISFSSALTYDKICIWHEYKQGNTIIESRYQHKTTNLPTDGDDPFYETTSGSFTGYFFNNNLYCDTLYGSIEDFSANKDWKRFCLTATNNRKKLHFHRYGGKLPYIQPTIPDDFDLIKQ